MLPPLDKKYMPFYLNCHLEMCKIYQIKWKQLFFDCQTSSQLKAKGLENIILNYWSFV